ncbi:hypothetical protein E2C01_004520 [Portunus trituberculatus]|uniref:Uncharacterized protein n=1 Tax=Portunus trituberculatus TaxID=210409 RepID=A0A5B7CRK8_PORTR|nr:hypothetical protein [Portunus trituberculatus]
MREKRRHVTTYPSHPTRTSHWTLECRHRGAGKLKVGRTRGGTLRSVQAGEDAKGEEEKA